MAVVMVMVHHHQQKDAYFQHCFGAENIALWHSTHLTTTTAYRLQSTYRMPNTALGFYVSFVCLLIVNFANLMLYLGTDVICR